MFDWFKANPKEYHYTKPLLKVLKNKTKRDIKNKIRNLTYQASGKNLTTVQKKLTVILDSINLGNK